MADYEHMADGYKAHLFEDFKGNYRHLTQCGCWICDYHRQIIQQPHWQDDVPDFPVWLIEKQSNRYWGDSD